MTKVRLAVDWDIAIQPPRGADPPTGQFVGRARELDLLVNELLRSPQRSIFISGHRGVGKTSLIYRALHEVRLKEPSRDNQFLFVLMNAAQLEAEADEEHQIVPKQILMNLIRRLYTARTEANLPDKLARRIDDLYRKAVASEFLERFEDRQGIQLDFRQEETSEVSYGVTDFRPFVWLSTTGVAAFLAGLGPFDSDTLDRLVPILVAVPFPLTLSFLLRSRSARTAASAESRDAQTLYEFDNSIGNLEFDLEGLHRSLTAAHITTIYVIDELDKIEPDPVIEVLKFFKNLFTLSAAIFVFVGGEELASRFGGLPMADEDAPIYRPKEYTYFTSQYFLSRPSEADLTAYLDRVMASSTTVTDEDKAVSSSFKKLIIFDAHGDFFDAIRRVRDRITGFEEITPIIDIAPFSPDEERRIALQHALSLLFSEKYEVGTPSRWHENEDVLRGLYSAAHAIAQAYPGMPIASEDRDTPAGAARRDFYTFLARLGVLTIVDTSTIQISGRTVSTNSYHYSSIGRITIPPTLDFLSEPETLFVDAFNELLGKVGVLLNIERQVNGRTAQDREATRKRFQSELARASRWGVDLLSLLPRSVETYRDLTQHTPPRSFSREDIEKAQEEVQSADAAVRNHAPSAVVNILAQKIRDATTSSLASDLNAFAEDKLASLRTELVNAPHGLLSRPDRTLLVTSALEDEDVRRHRETFRTYEKTHRVLAVGRAERDLRVKPKGLRSLSWDDEDGNNGRVVNSTMKWLLD